MTNGIPNNQAGPQGAAPWRPEGVHGDVAAASFAAPEGDTSPLEASPFRLPQLDQRGVVGPLSANQAAALVRASTFAQVAGTNAARSARVAGGVTCYATHEPQGVVGQRVVCVMGAFDGLHEGHRSLVKSALSDARVQELSCVAVTFNPDPAEVLVGVQPGTRLLSCSNRARGLLALGVDYVLSFSFTKEEANTSYQDFIRLQLGRVVRVASVHVGTNFRFGAGGAGTPEAMRALGNQDGFQVHAHDLLQSGSAVVSATRIRRILAQGDLGEATELFQRCHFVSGVVRHGRGEGTSFGFPTANVVCDVRDCLPKEGVYACFVVHGNSAWPAAANVGAPPSFSSPMPAFLEANLLGFSGDLYDEPVQVVFVRWLRASRKFASLEQLEQAVFNNIDWVRINLGDARLEVGLD